MRVNVYYANGTVEKNRTMPYYTKLNETVIENLQNGNVLFVDRLGNAFTKQEFIPKANLTAEGETLAKNHGFMIKE